MEDKPPAECHQDQRDVVDLMRSSPPLLPVSIEGLNVEVGLTNTWGCNWTINWSGQQIQMQSTGMDRAGSISSGGWGPSTSAANSS